MGNGNRPTPEFRREAMRLVLTNSRTRRKIAEDPGLGLSSLTRWLGQEGVGPSARRHEAGQAAEPVLFHCCLVVIFPQVQIEPAGFGCIGPE